MNILSEGTSWSLRGLAPLLIGAVVLAAIVATIAFRALRRRPPVDRRGVLHLRPVAPPDTADTPADPATGPPSASDAGGEPAEPTNTIDPADDSLDGAASVDSTSLPASLSLPRRAPAAVQSGLDVPPSSETVPTSPTVPVWRDQVTAWLRATKPAPIPAPPDVPEDRSPSTLAQDEERRGLSQVRIPPPPSVP